MKRTIRLCILSALGGALASVGLQGLSKMEMPSAAAQDAAAWPRRQPQAVAQTPLGTPVPAPQSASAPPYNELTPEERINVNVYQVANRSVVNINTRGSAGDYNFFLIEKESKGEGSGTVIDKAGHILTNYHVVEGARTVDVTLFDGSTHSARLVGGDLETDVAVLKIEAPAESLIPVTFGNSSGLLVGQCVYAIGNPFGQERTLSTGIISGLDRQLPSKRGRRLMKSIIQTDAAINPGNSGGPLLNSHARMIGMNTAIASRTGESAGVSFAIPVNTIARVVPQLIQNGHVRRPDTGIMRVRETNRGLLIYSLVPGGAAERAGLQGAKIERTQKRQGPIVYYEQRINIAAADLIVAVDEKPILSADSFLDAIEAKQPGEQVVLTVIRAGQTIQVPLTLEEGE